MHNVGSDEVLFQFKEAGLIGIGSLLPVVHVQGEDL
jgi:hypothetical protein